MYQWQMVFFPWQMVLYNFGLYSGGRGNLLLIEKSIHVKRCHLRSQDALLSGLRIVLMAYMFWIKVISSPKDGVAWPCFLETQVLSRKGQLLLLLLLLCPLVCFPETPFLLLLLLLLCPQADCSLPHIFAGTTSMDHVPNKRAYYSSGISPNSLYM